MSAWILSLLIALQPVAPWRASYENTAKEIAQGIEESKPLFSEPRKGAALLISLAWFESRFDVNAIGDHGKSFGLYQQQGLGPINGAKRQTVIAIEQIRKSMRICANRPLVEMLGWYAAGGPNCDRGLRESRHRVLKAMWIERNL